MRPRTRYAGTKKVKASTGNMTSTPLAAIFPIATAASCARACQDQREEEAVQTIPRPRYCINTGRKADIVLGQLCGMGSKRHPQRPVQASRRVPTHEGMENQSMIAGLLEKWAKIATETELASKTARFIKVELKRSGVTYGELAKRLEDQGLTETEASIANKLARATVPAIFLLATLAALERDGIRLDDV